MRPGGERRTPASPSATAGRGSPSNAGSAHSSSAAWDSLSGGKGSHAPPGHPWSEPAVQGIGARQPSRPPGSTTRSGATSASIEAELLAGVEERRAPQAEQEHRGGPRPGLGAAVAGAVPGVVVVGEHPGRPAADGVEQRRSVVA